MYNVIEKKQEPSIVYIDRFGILEQIKTIKGCGIRVLFFNSPFSIFNLKNIITMKSLILAQDER